MSNLIPPTPLAYTGATSAPLTIQKAIPLPSNYQFDLGTIWVNQLTGIAYILTSKPNSVSPPYLPQAEWEPISNANLGNYISTINGILPAGDGNFNLLGGSNITITGGMNQDTISVSGVIPVSNGGTGNNALNPPNSVLLSGSTDTQPIVPIAEIGASGTVLTSNGTGSPPSWEASGFSSFQLNTQVFTSTGTYVPILNMVSCIVEVIGAGAGGGGADSSLTTSCGSGGGGGEYRRGTFSATQIGASVPITMGIGGTGGGSTTGNVGGNGGNTVFGALITANGGTGGVICDSNIQESPGGFGGTGGNGGTIHIDGTDGGGASYSATFASSGTGGQAAAYSGTTKFNVGVFGFNGNHALGSQAISYGSGGSGAAQFNYNTTPSIGGDGANGYVVVTEIYEVIASGSGVTFPTGVLTGNGSSTPVGSSVTQYAVLAGDAGNKVQSVSGTGTSGQVLTSNGAGTLPTWQSQGASATGVNVQVFTSSGTYVPTVGMESCMIECVSGGGGGGGAPAGSGGASGGSSAGYTRANFLASAIGASKSVTIASGGAGGTGNGFSAGNTSVGTLIISIGGNGGSQAGGDGSGGAGASSGASPGSVTGAIAGTAIIVGGSASEYGFFISAQNIVRSGNGGGSYFGGTAQGGTYFNSSGNGVVGNAYGAGGAGAGSHGAGGSVSGGNGAGGIVIITEYIV